MVIWILRGWLIFLAGDELFGPGATCCLWFLLPCAGICADVPRPVLASAWQWAHEFHISLVLTRLSSFPCLPTRYFYRSLGLVCSLSTAQGIGSKPHWPSTQIILSPIWFYHLCSTSSKVCLAMESQPLGLFALGTPFKLFRVSLTLPLSFYQETARVLSTL